MHSEYLLLNFGYLEKSFSKLPPAPGKSREQVSYVLELELEKMVGFQNLGRYVVGIVLANFMSA